MLSYFTSNHDLLVTCPGGSRKGYGRFRLTGATELPTGFIHLTNYIASISIFFLTKELRLLS